MYMWITLLKLTPETNSLQINCSPIKFKNKSGEWPELLFSANYMYSDIVVVQSLSRVWLCDPMDFTSGFPVHHQLPEFAQSHVHWIGDAIQPSHPLSSPSPPAFNLSQHQGLFQWVGSSNQAPKCWSFSFSISSSNEYLGRTPFRLDWLDLLAGQGTLKSLLQHHSSKASVLWHSAFFIVQLSHPYMTTGKTIALTRQMSVITREHHCWMRSKVFWHPKGLSFNKLALVPSDLHASAFPPKGGDVENGFLSTKPKNLRPTFPASLGFVRKGGNGHRILSDSGQGSETSRQEPVGNGWNQQYLIEQI